MVKKLIKYLEIAPQKVGVSMILIGLLGSVFSVLVDTFRNGEGANISFGPAQFRLFIFSLLVFLCGLVLTISQSRELFIRLFHASLENLGCSSFVRILDVLISRGLLLLAGCIFALVIAEIGLRIYSPFILRIKGQMIDLPRNIRIDVENPGIEKLDANIVHTKNSLGFRGDDPPINFNDYLTIITVGGSTTECYYLSDGYDWPEQLAADLKQKVDKVWVNNAGLDGHSTFGHLVLMRDYIIKFKPKVVLFLVGLNDMAYNMPRSYEEWIIESGKEIGKNEVVPPPISPEDQPSFPCFSSFGCFTKSAAPYSVLANLVWNLMRSREAYRVDLGHQALDLEKRGSLVIDDAQFNLILQKYQQEYLPNYRDRIKSLIEISRENGIEPVFVTQPALYGSGVDDVTGVDLETVSVTGDANGKLQWAILELYNDIVREEGIKNKLLVIDLARQMPKSSKYYYDFYHFDNQGASVVGEIIYKALYPYLTEKGIVK